MAVNDTIRTPDYNSIQSTLAGIMSTGSGTSGWGQPMKSSQVAVGNKVTINEWGNLRYDIINAYTHIFGSTGSPVLVNEGNTVRYDATTSPITQYDTLTTTIVSNKFTVGAGQYATTGATTSTTTWPSALYGSYWAGRIACLITIYWSDANYARWFFNSGGTVRIATSRTGGTGSPQNNSWSSILSSAGTREFGGNLPGTGTSPADGSNWYRMTNSWQPWYSISGSSPYGSNTYRIYSTCPYVSNASGSATQGQFLVELVDNYTDPGQSPYNPTPDYIDSVDGTFTVSVSLKYATGVLVPAGFGNFTVTQPTVVVGAIAP